jgi:hypothetical protein
MSVVKIIGDSFVKTGIGQRDFSVEKEHNYPYYVIKIYCGLTCADMEKISKWIRDKFTVENRWTHLLPKLGIRDGCMSLVIDKELAEKIFV